MHTQELALLLASPSLSYQSAVCAPPPPPLSSPLGPAGVPDLLGLLPSDGQQARGPLGELALPNDDQVPDCPCAQQVPVGRGREEEVREG